MEKKERDINKPRVSFLLENKQRVMDQKKKPTKSGHRKIPTCVSTALIVMGMVTHEFRGQKHSCFPTCDCPCVDEKRVQNTEGHHIGIKEIQHHESLE